jgi:hypothetical protein
MALWVCIGIPSFVLGQGFRGHFSLLPDPPPFMYSSEWESRIFGTLTWGVAVVIVYLPLFLVPALLVWRRRQRISAAEEQTRNPVEMN